MTGSKRRYRPPRQQRSQHTAERILEAAEQLISERGIEQLTMADLARRGKSSIGAIYARFGDRETVLRSVFERFYAEAVAIADGVFDPRQWTEVPLSQLVHQAVVLMLGIFRERRQLISAFTVRAARLPEWSALGERLGLDVAERAYAFLLKRGEPITHPQPQLAVRFAVMVVLSALEARSLYTVDALRLMPDQAIAQELTRMCLSYLGMADAAATTTS